MLESGELQFELQVDTRKLQKVYERMPVAVHRRLNTAMIEVGHLVANAVKQLTPVGVSGHLRRSIQPSVRGYGLNIEARIGSPLPYASPVETGTRPHTPPIEPIRLWARRVLGDEKAAGAVWQSIRKRGTSMYALRTRGTKGYEMFKRGFAQTEDAVKEKIEKAIDAAVRGV